MISFGKVSTAMVTPFDSSGNIDFQKTTALVEYLIHNGSDSLVVAGTTGESPTLSSEEKIALIKHTAEIVKGRIPVIAGTGSNNTLASIDLTKKAEKAGADAIMLVAPYYNKPSQEGMYQHFKAIAEATSLPVMIYNVPGRTAVSIAPETVIRLAEISNIAAVKDASGNLEAISEIIENTPEDFQVYCGDDSLTLPVLAIGGTGIVSVASHLIGNEMQDMIQSFFIGDVKAAAASHRKLLPLMKQLFAAPSPAPVKTGLQIKGLDVGPVRLPLLPLTEIERQELTRLLK
ncbi:4-hydroxy-tetrahydrodipicolinate synthase [Metabacillus sp. GX 13764]|uniref:4-hydroxy-tetrahydrodipicolinate synthase n=1 Tax=Metabacillus kandeliae TaxID=2900151 RepID=UPI001E3208F6|nr:4-hydroxy-tetrahydrodipicolinate synthase [Metabacillus kandeliae]MCD7033726.1 4-hydroxy-tetrahydrodipicolinate synthase [Metabacillus kandeliae]